MANEQSVTAKRLTLSEILNAIPDIKKVYYQPDEGTKLEYPCILYKRDPTSVTHADNIKYRLRGRYQITLIDRLPDHSAFDVLLSLPYCSHSASFVADGLNHDIFDLYH